MRDWGKKAGSLCLWMGIHRLGQAGGRDGEESLSERITKKLDIILTRGVSGNKTQMTDVLFRDTSIPNSLYEIVKC